MFNKLWQLIEQEKDCEAQKLQYFIQECSERMQPYQEIPMIKQYLKSEGIIRSDICRIPFYTVPDQEKREIEATIKMIKGKFMQEERNG